MRFIFIFIDGIGIGSRNGNNPFISADPGILRLWKGARASRSDVSLKPIDPLLGVNGIPQSATGQTSIFTGINIPKLLSKHTGSFPNRAMRKIISRENLLLKITKSGKKGAFINAYPHHSDLFSSSHVNIDDQGNLQFSAEFPEKFKRRISVTSSILISNRTKPYDTRDILEKRSLYQDYSNRSLRQYGLDLPIFTPEDAAGIIYSASGNYDLVLYEYFQSDIFGHRKKPEEQIGLIVDLDNLLTALIEKLDPGKDTLLVTSDHGNLEDSSGRSHTLNPVPLITWGRGSGFLSETVNNLAEVTPGIMSYLNGRPSQSLI